MDIRSLIFLCDEDREAGVALITGQQEELSLREPKELRFRHRDGGAVWLELSVRTFDDGRTIGSLYNITERKRAREELQKAYDQLEVRVEERTTALRETNKHLEQEIAGRNKIQAALHRAKETAEAATRAKSEFLAKMSHELRTPMNAIIGFARLVMRRCKDILPRKQYENLEKILISAERLLALINDILDLSKVEAGRIEINPVNFPLEPLIETCLHTVEPMVKDERLQLLKEMDPDLPSLTTDKDRLQQIIINLLSNAVKFTESGTVTINARPHEGKIMIAVADTGIGIPTEALERIFEEFHQVDGGTTRQYGGTGLGLSISRHFAHLLGGDITVKSAPRMGSTFTLTVPVNYEAGHSATENTCASAEDNLAAATATDTNVVLVIDDDPNVIYLLQENLADAGYRVIGAASAEEGRQKAREIRPFAITLDILMPQQDGWQMLHELKSDMTTRHIPVIVLSVVDNKDLAHRLGAFDCLLKPIDRDLMLTTLARVAPVLRRSAEQEQTNEKNLDRGGRGVQPRSPGATFGGRLRDPDRDSRRRWGRASQAGASRIDFDGPFAAGSRWVRGNKED